MWPCGGLLWPEVGFPMLAAPNPGRRPLRAGNNCRKDYLLTPGPAPEKVAPCLVSSETNSPSPAQRSAHAGAQKANSYQFVALLKQQRSSGRGINSSAHADHHTCFLLPAHKPVNSP